MTVRSSVSLTDEQQAFARALVEAGHYPNIGAVLCRGSKLTHQRAGAEDLETSARRVLLSQRREGAFVTAEAMDTRLDGLIAEKRSVRGLPR